jgi:hypothetical protein
MVVSRPVCQSFSKHCTMSFFRPTNNSQRSPRTRNFQTCTVRNLCGIREGTPCALGGKVQPFDGRNEWVFDDAIETLKQWSRQNHRVIGEHVKGHNGKHVQDPRPLSPLLMIRSDGIRLLVERHGLQELRARFMAALHFPSRRPKRLWI